MKNLFLMAGVLALTSVAAQAHDTWVETNTNIFRAGDCVHIDLKLGNHGNQHRDFKLASKVPLDSVSLQVIAPGGVRFDLKNRLIDTGSSPKEGFWTTQFTARKPGMYTVLQTFDSVMSYAPERAIKSAKTFFVVAKNLERVPVGAIGFDRKWGHGLELIPESNPVTVMRPGTPLKLRLYFKGKPLAGTRVSFVPEGENLKGDFDARYEAKTNINGRVVFTPNAGKRYLCVAHYETKENGQNAAGKKYDFTQYGATLTLYVP